MYSLISPPSQRTPAPAPQPQPTLKIITSNINNHGHKKRSRQSSITEDKTYMLHKSFDQGQSQEAVQSAAEKVSTIAIVTQDGFDSKTNINRGIDQDTNPDTSRKESERLVGKGEKSGKEEHERLNAIKLASEMERQLEPGCETQETLGHEGTKTQRNASGRNVAEEHDHVVKFRFGASLEDAPADKDGKP